jgi:hypothetical protein
MLFLLLFILHILLIEFAFHFERCGKAVVFKTKKAGGHRLWRCAATVQGLTFGFSV